MFPPYSLYVGDCLVVVFFHDHWLEHATMEPWATSFDEQVPSESCTHSGVDTKVLSGANAPIEQTSSDVMKKKVVQQIWIYSINGTSCVFPSGIFVFLLSRQDILGSCFLLLYLVPGMCVYVGVRVFHFFFFIFFPPASGSVFFLFVGNQAKMRNRLF